MRSSSNVEGTRVLAKAKYHHGDLREALISAVHQLVVEQGADAVTLADACRLAGVSTAAPYRHFRDRDEVLAEVTARGFDKLREMAAESIAKHGEGTLEGITAMAQSYVAFSVAQQGLFRLMFGQNPALSEIPLVSETGNRCFGFVIEQVAKYCAVNCVEGNADDIAIKLWTFVHGAASLLIDEKYDRVAVTVDVDELIRSATGPLLGQANPTGSADA